MKGDSELPSGRRLTDRPEAPASSEEQRNAFESCFAIAARKIGLGEEAFNTGVHIYLRNDGKNSSGIIVCIDDVQDCLKLDKIFSLLFQSAPDLSSVLNDFIDYKVSEVKLFSGKAGDISVTLLLRCPETSPECHDSTSSGNAGAFVSIHITDSEITVKKDGLDYFLEELVDDQSAASAKLLIMKELNGIFQSMSDCDSVDVLIRLFAKAMKVQLRIAHVSTIHDVRESIRRVLCGGGSLDLGAVLDKIQTPAFAADLVETLVSDSKSVEGEDQAAASSEDAAKHRQAVFNAVKCVIMNFTEGGRRFSLNVMQTLESFLKQ